eukprot:CAMPEP_0194288236 /NCGR_PEP_ID=MMETSP0169-20130528/36405_1 /TAXON_ID=218684 /ORGANISM="Corethron pennatum, Strain L29A3" /LENGTH=845 /DNA_ID=CAMNT_0039035179 /DNA_START=217 /DNA_END=2754 /DNA_ORIENTATION=-
MKSPKKTRNWGVFNHSRFSQASPSHVKSKLDIGPPASPSSTGLRAQPLHNTSPRAQPFHNKSPRAQPLHNTSPGAQPLPNTSPAQPLHSTEPSKDSHNLLISDEEDEQREPILDGANTSPRSKKKSPTKGFLGFPIKKNSRGIQNAMPINPNRKGQRRRRGSGPVDVDQFITHGIDDAANTSDTGLSNSSDDSNDFEFSEQSVTNLKEMQSTGLSADEFSAISSVAFKEVWSTKGGDSDNEQSVEFPAQVSLKSVPKRQDSPNKLKKIHQEAMLLPPSPQNPVTSAVNRNSHKQSDRSRPISQHKGNQRGVPLSSPSRTEQRASGGRKGSLSPSKQSRNARPKFESSQGERFSYSISNVQTKASSRGTRPSSPSYRSTQSKGIERGVSPSSRPKFERRVSNEPEGSSISDIETRYFGSQPKELSRNQMPLRRTVSYQIKRSSASPSKSYSESNIPLRRIASVEEKEDVYLSKASVGSTVSSTSSKQTKRNKRQMQKCSSFDPSAEQFSYSITPSDNLFASGLNNCAISERKWTQTSSPVALLPKLDVSNIIQEEEQYEPEPKEPTQMSKERRERLEKYSMNMPTANATLDPYEILRQQLLQKKRLILPNITSYEGEFNDPAATVLHVQEQELYRGFSPTIDSINGQQGRGDTNDEDPYGGSGNTDFVNSELGPLLSTEKDPTLWTDEKNRFGHFPINNFHSIISTDDNNNGTNNAAENNDSDGESSILRNIPQSALLPPNPAPEDYRYYLPKPDRQEVRHRNSQHSKIAIGREYDSNLRQRQFAHETSTIDLDNESFEYTLQNSSDSSEEEFPNNQIVDQVLSTARETTFALADAVNIALDRYLK